MRGLWFYSTLLVLVGCGFLPAPDIPFDSASWQGETRFHRHEDEKGRKYRYTLRQCMEQDAIRVVEAIPFSTPKDAMKRVAALLGPPSDKRWTWEPDAPEDSPRAEEYRIEEWRYPLIEMEPWRCQLGSKSLLRVLFTRKGLFVNAKPLVLPPGPNVPFDSDAWRSASLLPYVSPEGVKYRRSLRQRMEADAIRLLKEIDFTDQHDARKQVGALLGRADYFESKYEPDAPFDPIESLPPDEYLMAEWTYLLAAGNQSRLRVLITRRGIFVNAMPLAQRR